MPIYKSGQGKSPAVKKQEMQNLILEISEKIAENEGWDSVTMRRIASEIDKSLPIVYRHFTAKEEIIDIVAQRGYIKLYELLTQEDDDKASLDKRIYKYFKIYCNFAIQKPAIYQAMYGMNGISEFQENQTEEGKKIYRHYLDKLSPYFTNQGGISKARVILNIIWSTLHGYVSLANLDRLDYSDEYIETFVSEFSKIINGYLKN
jgi:AcrR family transcriptional regulator